MERQEREKPMKLSLKYIAPLAVVAGGVIAGKAMAADFGPPPPPPAPPVVYVAPDYRCMRWSQRCEFRWGLGTWRYARCMYRHSCGA